MVRVPVKESTHDACREDSKYLVSKNLNKVLRHLNVDICYIAWRILFLLSANEARNGMT